MADLDKMDPFIAKLAANLGQEISGAVKSSGAAAVETARPFPHEAGVSVAAKTKIELV